MRVSERESKEGRERKILTPPGVHRVRDCRNSTCASDFKLRCREFRSHIDWDAVDASASQGLHGGGRLTEWPKSKARSTSKPSGGASKDLSKGADGKRSADREGRAGRVRLGKGETNSESAVDVGVDEGNVGSVDDTQAGGAGSARSSQRAERGIVDMRRMVNRLVRRIHYSAFSCPSKETWVDYHRTVDRSSTASEVAERLVWAARQLLPGMLRAAWLSRKEQWEARCLACRDKNALRLLKFELEKYAISWEAVEASTTQLAALYTAVKNEGKGKLSNSGQKRSHLRADVPVKDKSKAEQGSGKKARLDLEGGKGREERYKRRRCHASDGVGGSGTGAGQEGASTSRGESRDAADVVQRVLEYRPDSMDLSSSAGGRSESERVSGVVQKP